MDEAENPFSLGAGNPPAALTGRDPEITQFCTLLKRLGRGRFAQSMVISGLRGVGKTVLLGRLEEEAISAGWVVPTPIEVKSTTNFRSEIADLAYNALLGLSTRRAIGDRAKRIGRFLTAFKVGISPEGFEIGFDADSLAATGVSGDLERDLTFLFQELGEVATEDKTGVVFLIDEMQFLDRVELEALTAAMHRMSQRKLPVALAAAGLPQLPGQMVEAKSYAERLFSYPRLDKLAPGAASGAIRIPLDEEKVRIEPDALERLVQLADRYPAFIQAYAEQAWNTAKGLQITLEDVEAAAPLVLARLDAEFFSVRLEKATPKEREYLSAMGALGDGWQLSSAVATQLGRNPRSVAPHRDSLIKKGLIYSPQYSYVDFTVPHFADFMRRTMPFGSVVVP